MGRYVYIDKDSKKGRFGIGVGVFEVLARQALTRVPDLADDPGMTKHRHKLLLNSTHIHIHHGVVYVKVHVNAKRGVNYEKVEENIVNEINSTFMILAEQVPVSIKVKIENA